MKTSAIGPWFIETDKQQRELLNDLISDINICLESITMPKQSNVTIYVVLDKYASPNSVIAAKPTPDKIILDELTALFLDVGWNNIKVFSYNDHSLGLEVVNEFLKDKPMLYYYLIRLDSKGDVRPPQKLKKPLEAVNQKIGEGPPEKFIG